MPKRKSSPSTGGIRIKGTVREFDVQKGFGFLFRDDGQRDVFVHRHELHVVGERILRPNERVEFSVGIGKSGRNEALYVTKIIAVPEVQTRKPHGIARHGGDEFDDDVIPGGVVRPARVHRLN